MGANNSICLKSIYDLLDMNFFIPDYQRGYRWSQNQVTDLLNDIYSFASKKGKSEEEFYCLQPIVVKKCNQETMDKYNLVDGFGDNTWYEVVDGQQRLTTIKILFLYLLKYHLKTDSLKQDYRKELFKIKYATRPNSEEFLNSLMEAGHQKNSEYIDYDYIDNAYSYIDNWINTNTKDLPGKVRATLFDPLINTKDNQTERGTIQVIWYELEESENSIDTFTRLNIGKIPLTNAELIKALFLQKSNFTEAEVEPRQSEIALEWDRIEYSLQNDEFWYFLNEEINNTPARIEFIFDVMYKIACKKEPELLDKFGTDNDRTFRYFAYRILEEKGKVTEIWSKEVKAFFNTFEEWFTDSVWYHYIGFLIYCGVDIVTIYDFYKDKPKDEFLAKIKEKIRENVPVKYKVLKTPDNTKEYDVKLSYDDNKTLLRKVLLLLNIEYIVKQEEKTYIRFPFDRFKKESWDIEHIDSFTENDMNDRAQQKLWLSDSVSVLEDDVKYQNLVNQIKEFLESFDEAKNAKDKFLEFRTSILQAVGEQVSENSEDDKKSIGNLTLLDAGTNRSYGNALFPVKRKTIIEKDSHGQFIPICTKYVFLKYFNKGGASISRWNNSDIKSYRNFVVETLADFFILEGGNN